MRRLTPLVGVAAVIFVGSISAAGCGSSDVNAINGGPPGGGSGDDGGGGGFSNDGGGGGGGGGGHGDGGGDFCSGSGVAIPIPGGNDLCTGDVARKVFKMAVCSCTTASASGALHTDSFNSALGADAGSNRLGGSIGADETLTASGTYAIGGSAYAANALASTGNVLALNGSGEVSRDVWTGGNVSATTLTVDNDVYATGNVNGLGSAKGHIHLTSGHTTQFSCPNPVDDKTAFKVPTPCDCTDKLDIAKIVASFKTSNDNGKLNPPLSPDALKGVGATVNLPCGKYYLTEISGTGSTTIHALGRVALFVDGDVSTAGTFDIKLDPGAEIDLFAKGNFVLSGAQAFGSLTAPSKVRIYVGGTQFNVSGAANVGGNFYAPNAPVNPAGNFEISGSIFGKSVNPSGALTVHYDEAVIDVQGCQPPTGGSCHSCNDCTNACNGGTCGACQTNADCCAPLACTGGTCTVPIR